MFYVHVGLCWSCSAAICVGRDANPTILAWPFSSVVFLLVSRWQVWVSVYSCVCNCLYLCECDCDRDSCYGPRGDCVAMATERKLEPFMVKKEASSHCCFPQYSRVLTAGEVGGWNKGFPLLPPPPPPPTPPPLPPSARSLPPSVRFRALQWQHFTNTSLMASGIPRSFVKMNISLSNTALLSRTTQSKFKKHCASFHIVEFGAVNYLLSRLICILYED